MANRRDKEALSKKKVQLPVLPAGNPEILKDDPVQLLPSDRRIWPGQ
jgi:hypothetical protein